MKVIFLDCDGVINSEEHLRATYEDRFKLEHWQRHISINLLNNLAEVVHKTGAKIVLSSCWRLGFNEDGTPDPEHENCQKLSELLKERNCEIIGKTGRVIVDCKSHRSSEIQEYLDNHPEVDKFIIIDDDDYDIVKGETYEFFDEVHKTTGFFTRDKFVQTNWKEGLTKEKAEEAIRKLED